MEVKLIEFVCRNLSKCLSEGWKVVSDRLGKNAILRLLWQPSPE